MSEAASPLPGDDEAQLLLSGLDAMRAAAAAEVAAVAAEVAPQPQVLVVEEAAHDEPLGGGGGEDEAAARLLHPSGEPIQVPVQLSAPFPTSTGRLPAAAAERAPSAYGGGSGGAAISAADVAWGGHVLEVTEHPSVRAAVMAVLLVLVLQVRVCAEQGCSACMCARMHARMHACWLEAATAARRRLTDERMPAQDVSMPVALIAGSSMMVFDFGLTLVARVGGKLRHWCAAADAVCSSSRARVHWMALLLTRRLLALLASQAVRAEPLLLLAAGQLGHRRVFLPAATGAAARCMQAQRTLCHRAYARTPL